MTSPVYSTLTLLYILYISFAVQCANDDLTLVAPPVQLDPDMVTQSPVEAVYNTFTWKTGEWGPCQGSECGPGGVQHRALGCYHTSGYETLDFHCRDQPRPSTERPCYRICEDQRHVVSWVVSDWSSCDKNVSKEPCPRGVIDGIQTRNVTCHDKLAEQPLPDPVCNHFDPKPQIQRVCTYTCPRDCIVTDFTSWSKCSCQNRTRTRTVISPPLYGGRGCPQLSEYKACGYKCKKRGAEYMYELGNWSACRRRRMGRRVPYQTLGYQRRSVRCVARNGTRVEERFCADTAPVPVSRRTCSLDSDCTVSNWSGWKSVNRSCVTETGELIPGHRIRQRTVMLLPVGDGASCPVLQQSEPDLEDNPQHMCDDYVWMTTSWGACQQQLSDTERNVPQDGSCRLGLQYRQVICMRKKDQVPVGEFNCRQDRPLHVQPCPLPCVQSCLLSAWSGWGECQPARCVTSRLAQLERGHRIRSRQILHHPGTSECPHLYESRSCYYPVCYKWHMSQFGTCQLLDNLSRCGAGIRSRKVICTGYHENGPVADDHCLSEAPKPTSKDPCHVPCQGDCVLSEWSQWTPCSRLCTTSKKQPGFRTRERNILMQATGDGRPCPDDLRLQESVACYPESCAVYHWQTNDWEECVPKDNKTRCGAGTHRRQTTCKRGDKTVPEKRCFELVRPVEEQNCSIACTVHCKMTKYSDWSPCPVTCLSDVSPVEPYQERYRYILQEPQHGGAECPWVTREKRVCPGLARCAVYDWDVTPWSMCRLPPGDLQCGEGLRTRDIYCLRGSEITTVHECVFHGLHPASTVEPCQIACDDQCEVSMWSQFSHCADTCSGSIVRTRFLIGDSITKADCRDKSRYPMVEEKNCSCDDYTVEVMGVWSDCLLLSDLEDPLGPQPLQCGTGRKFQALACANKAGERQPAFTCSHTAYLEEPCDIACPVDCAVTAWSGWGPCSATCGCGMQYRHRKVVQKSHLGGRKCPIATKKKEREKRQCCQPRCDHYRWSAGAWGACQPREVALDDGGLSGCLIGTQTRSVRCLHRTESAELRRVNSSLCSALLRPEDDAVCDMPCGNDCVMSNWGLWSTCATPCNSQQSRTRSRVVLKPTLEGQSCLHGTESERCIMNITCFDYAWAYSEWSSCNVPDKAGCGEGVKTRYKTCQRSDGTTVPESYCTDSEVAVLEKRCEVECDVDCILAVWSEWTHCDKTCGVGLKRRYRHVVRRQRGNGRECPHILVQTMPCPYTPCYEWRVSVWSACTVERNTCGSGKRHRNLTCVQDGNTEVDSQLCSAVKRPKRTESHCRLACPGDCVMSDWTEWGVCHRICTHREQAGVQVRSRHVLRWPEVGGATCPDKLWESRPCRDDACHMYNWHTSPWTNETRRIWCERSDGLRVLGGCSEALRPGLVKECQPPCNISGSYCHDTNLCQCTAGYEPVYKDSQLIDCNMSGVNTTQKMQGGTDMQAIYLPPDSITNVWMYLVIGLGCAFVAFVAIAVYTICRHMERDRRHARPLERLQQTPPTAAGGASLVANMASGAAYSPLNQPGGSQTNNVQRRILIPP